jgi:hypothetical protein
MIISFAEPQTSFLEDESEEIGSEEQEQGGDSGDRRNGMFGDDPLYQIQSAELRSRPRAFRRQRRLRRTPLDVLLVGKWVLFNQSSMFQ